MKRTYQYLSLLLSPEDSTTLSSHGTASADGDIFRGFFGAVKALFWIAVSIAVSLTVAGLC